MSKNKGNNGAVRVKYVKDTEWARDTGRYLKEGTLIGGACSRQESWDPNPADCFIIPYTTVRFDGERNETNVEVASLELA